jgi:hypothetical protein
VSANEAQETIDLIRQEIEAAAETMLAVAENGLRALREARENRDGTLDALEQGFQAIMEASAFHDIAGQRLSRLSMLICPTPASVDTADSLLNGPAAPGQGLDQAAADALFSTPGS